MAKTPRRQPTPTELVKIDGVVRRIPRFVDAKGKPGPTFSEWLKWACPKG